MRQAWPNLRLKSLNYRTVKIVQVQARRLLTKMGKKSLRQTTQQTMVIAQERKIARRAPKASWHRQLTTLTSRRRSSLLTPKSWPTCDAKFSSILPTCRIITDRSRATQMAALHWLTKQSYRSSEAHSNRLSARLDRNSWRVTSIWPQWACLSKRWTTTAFCRRSHSCRQWHPTTSH